MRARSTSASLVDVRGDDRVAASDAAFQRPSDEQPLLAGGKSVTRTEPGQIGRGEHMPRDEVGGCGDRASRGSNRFGRLLRRLHCLSAQQCSRFDASYELGELARLGRKLMIPEIGEVVAQGEVLLDD